MTLQSALNRIIVITLVLVAVVSFALIFAYAQIKQSLSIQTLEALLRKNSVAQAEALLPSFLMPEQKAGISLMLSRFKDSDALQDAQVIGPKDPLPVEFAACQKTESGSYCTDVSRQRIATLIPISLEGKKFGYLLKTKLIPNFFENDHLLLLIEILVGTGILSFLILFLFLGRVTSFEVPSDLNELASWIERLLRDESAEQIPELKFQEVRVLAKKIEEILRRDQALRDQAVIGQLTSGIMHDLRNPLHPLVTALELVEEQEEPGEKRLKRLENLYRVCKCKVPVMGEIIESTLDGGREIALTPELVDIRKAIFQSAFSLHGMMKKKGIQLKMNLGSQPIEVLHDAGQLSRVFTNLLKNSIEAIPIDSGELHIEICKRDLAQVRIIFEDSGPGLPKNAEAVFRAFRSTKPRGTGLGLVISRKIVEAHQGQLVAGHSENLSGARFEVVLPLTGEAVQEACS